MKAPPGVAVTAPAVKMGGFGVPPSLLVALALAPQRMSWYAMVDTRIWEAGREVWEAGMQGGMGGMGGRHSCNFVCCVGGIIVDLL